MTTLTEAERSFLYNEFVTLSQNANQRDLYGADFIKSIMNKAGSVAISFTVQETGLVQSYLTYRQEGLARLTDKRLQFILQQQNSQGFGADHGDRNHFFNPYTQYNLCLSIISKLGP